MKYLLLLVAASLLKRAAGGSLEGAADFKRAIGLAMARGRRAKAKGPALSRLTVQRKVLIRKSYAQYATSRHEDLMVVYLEKDLKAIYFDNEDHVIHYTVESGRTRCDSSTNSTG